MINPVPRQGGKRRLPGPRLGSRSGGGGGERSPVGGPGASAATEPQRRRRPAPQFLASALYRSRPRGRSGTRRGCPAGQRPLPRPHSERPAGAGRGRGCRISPGSGAAGENAGLRLRRVPGSGRLLSPRAAPVCSQLDEIQQKNAPSCALRWSVLGSSPQPGPAKGLCLTRTPRPEGSRRPLLTERGFASTFLCSTSRRNPPPPPRNSSSVRLVHCQLWSHTRLKRTKQLEDIISVRPTVNKT